MKTKKKQKLKISDKAKEILKKTGLNFIIHKVHTPVVFGKTEYENPYYFLLNPRTKQVINTVKKNYFVTQNKVIVEMVLQGLKKFKKETLEITKGGSIHGGRRIFLQLRIKGDAFVGQDQVEKYITFIDSNDGSTQLSVGIGDKVMSCENEFCQFYKAGQSKYKHTASLEDRIDELPALLELALSRSMRMTELYQDMVETPITQKDVDGLVLDILGYNDIEDESLTGRAKANIQKLLDALDIELKDGMNVWNMHNGVTRWTTHTKQAPKRHNGRLESIFSPTGTNYRVNQKSFNYALNLIGKSIDVLEADLVESN
jgi:hypothetical protein